MTKKYQFQQAGSLEDVGQIVQVQVFWTKEAEMFGKKCGRDTRRRGTKKLESPFFSGRAAAHLLFFPLLLPPRRMGKRRNSCFAVLLFHGVDRQRECARRRKGESSVATPLGEVARCKWVLRGNCCTLSRLRRASLSALDGTNKAGEGNVKKGARIALS